LINSANWNTCFLSLKRFIKVTEGHYLKVEMAILDKPSKGISIDE
jgi:hypothetical protein